MRPFFGGHCPDRIGTGAIRYYRYLWVVAVMLGSVATLPMVWSFADIANGLMALSNLISLVALASVVAAETRAHFDEEMRLKEVPQGIADQRFEKAADAG